MKEKLKKLSYAVSVPTIGIIEGWNADPKSVVTRVINYALFFIGAIALVFVIYGGVLYITSGGDSEKTTKARNTLMYAVLGIIVVVISYAIVTWASNAPASI
jgi:uncharacterized membrane protein